MQHVSTLITQSPPESSGHTTPSGLTEAHMERLWMRMGRVYGHKWVSAYGESDDGTWLAGLWDVTPEQIGAGLEKCRTNPDCWPPTLPKFRSMCKPEKIKIHIPYISLPKPKQDKDVVQKSLENIFLLLGRTKI
mgnify:CR=1 FL=1